MLSVQGFYDGRQIQLPSDIKMIPNIRVIITFPDDEPEIFPEGHFQCETELTEKNGILVVKGESSVHPENLTRCERDCRLRELLNRAGQ
jgi:hypothetical protein